MSFSPKRNDVIAGFRSTGVYPCDRNALVPISPESKTTSLAEETGLGFIPILTPRLRRDAPVTPRFTVKEHSEFQKCFEENQDYPMDKRYNLWKEMYCHIACFRW